MIQVVLITFGIALVMLQGEIHLSSSQVLQDDLGFSDASMQWIITAFSAGYFTSALPISYFTRIAPSNVILTLSASFTALFTLALPFCTELPWYLAARFGQGAAAAGIATVGYPIIMDILGSRAKQFLSLLGVIITVLFTGGPIIGALVTEIWHWQGIYWISGTLLAAVAISFLRTKSHILTAAAQKAPLTRPFWLWSALSSTTLSILIAMAAVLMLYYTDKGPLQLSWYLGIGMAVNALAHAVNALISREMPYIITGCGLILTALTIPALFWHPIAPFITINAALGLISPVSKTQALAGGNSRHSAIYSMLRMGIIAASTALFSALYDGTLTSIMIGYSLLFALQLIVYSLLLTGKRTG
jgi:MFS family permease